MIYEKYITFVFIPTSSAKGIGQKPVPFALPVGGNRKKVN